jgi:hypothetical protein
MNKSKNVLHSGNTCYHSVQSLFFYRLLSNNVKIFIYTTIIFYHRLQSRIFVPKGAEMGWGRILSTCVTDIEQMVNA